MNTIAKISNINIENLDTGNYFQSLLKEAMIHNCLGEDRVKGIQSETISLMTKLVNTYTSNESSSVRVEKAREIYESACFCIGGYLKSLPDMEDQIQAVKTTGMNELFQLGLEVEKKNYEEAENLYQTLKKEGLSTANLAYKQTVYKGIGEFFPYYDIKYAAQEAGGTIDYPLAVEVTDLNGVEFMKEYLGRLYLENSFCRFFPEANIEGVLRGYQEDYKDLLLNIFEVIFMNALGLCILKRDIYNLNITEEDRTTLQSQLEPLSRNELLEKLTETVNQLAAYMNISNEELLVYMKTVIKALSQRLYHNLKLNKLETIFITIKEYKRDTGSHFKEGIPMDDEDLRNLIKEMQECRYTTVKIALVKKSVHSLSDLVEILDTSFYGREFEEVFTLLSEMELSVLMNTISDLENSYSFHESDYKEWQIALKKYKKLS